MKPTEATPDPAYSENKKKQLYKIPMTSALPLQKFCAADVSKMCSKKTGWAKDICEKAWEAEAYVCPRAVQTAHENCVAAVNYVETSDQVCNLAEKALTPAVEYMASHFSNVKPELVVQEFQSQWPAACQKVQAMISGKVGSGENACAYLEEQIAQQLQKYA